MKRGPKKNLSEYAVLLCSSSWLLMPSDQLVGDRNTMDEGSANIARNSHIYLISKMPRMSLDPLAFRYVDGEVRGEICYKKKGEENRIAFTAKPDLLDGAVDFKVSSYPHRDFYMVDGNGKEVRYFSLFHFLLSSGLHLDNPDFNQLPVLYVGQAYGAGKTTALDRLQNHSTLQRILADNGSQDPDNEIVVLTFEYSDYRFVTMMDGRVDNYSEQNESRRFDSIMNNPLTKKQQISLAEAGLIRFFRPPYNKIYRDNFPFKKSKILRSCYKLDFSGLVVEIGTEELGISLYSDLVQASNHHIARFDLVSHENRAGFFIFDDLGKQESRPAVISEKS